MTIRKHPWILETDGIDSYIWSADGEMLLHDEQYYPYVNFSDDEWKLLSAAPEMLEALLNLENDDGSIPPHAWALVCRAIEKAGGKK